MVKSSLIIAKSSLKINKIIKDASCKRKNLVEKYMNYLLNYQL